MKLWLCTILLVLTQFSLFAQKDGDSIIEHHFLKTKELLDLQKTDSAQFYVDQMIQRQLEIDSSKMIKLYYHIGALFHYAFHHDEAEIYLNKGIALADTSVKNMVLEDLYNEKGVVYFDNDRYTEALEMFNNALKIAYHINDSVGISLANNNVGLIYLETEDYQNALTFFNTSIKYSESDHFVNIKETAMNNIGIILYQQNKYQESLQLLLDAEQSLKVKNSRTGLDNIYLNQGLNYKELKEYKKASEKFEEALLLYHKDHNYERMLLCQVQHYHTAFLSGNEQKADELEGKILMGLDSLNGLKTRIDLFTYLSERNLKKGDTAQAYHYNKKLLEVKDEIILGQKDRQLYDLKNDANYSRATNELSDVQTNYQKVIEEKDHFAELNEQLSDRNKLIMVLSIAFLIVAICYIGLLWNSNRKQKLANQQLLQQKEQLNQQNEQILNSAEYASSMEKMLLQQMNPHFIFNALTTIEASVSVGDYEFSKEYISMFTTLLRKTLDYSRSEAISLVDEISFLKAYIELNKVKQGDEFEYQFEYDEDHVEDFVNTPPMLVQPFVENALIHGLYHKTNGIKKLSITIEPHDEYILWTIVDNGVGRVKSKEIGKTHKGISHGIKITSDRIKWMKNIYGHQFSIDYIDLEEGTKVVLKTPIVEV